MSYAMALSSQGAPYLVADPLPERRISTAPLRHEPPSKMMLRVALELAHPLAGDAELRTQLGQGRWLFLVQPVAAHQDVPLTGRHLTNPLLKEGVLHLPDHLIGHLRGSLVFD